MEDALMEVTAAILAGGLGTRLRSVVTDRPKILAPVHGRPYVSYLLDQLAEADVREVVLLTGYQAEQVRQVLGDCYSGMHLIHSVEPFPLGTGGAVRHALGHFTAPTILLLNGDSSCQVALDDFWRFHRCHSADASLVLARVADASRYGQVEIGPNGRVLGFHEKRQTCSSGWINAGIYLLSRRLLENLPPGQSASLERDLLPGWVSQGVVFGYPCAGQFLDIGTPESYAQAETFSGLRKKGTQLVSGPAGCSR
jgi:NDP-sugar pyrophosphorylase family protein